MKIGRVKIIGNGTKDNPFKPVTDYWLCKLVGCSPDFHVCGQLLSGESYCHCARCGIVIKL